MIVEWVSQHHQFLCLGIVNSPGSSKFGSNFCFRNIVTYGTTLLCARLNLDCLVSLLVVLCLLVGPIYPHLTPATADQMYYMSMLPILHDGPLIHLESRARCLPPTTPVTHLQALIFQYHLKSVCHHLLPFPFTKTHSHHHSLLDHCPTFLPDLFPLSQTNYMAKVQVSYYRSCAKAFRGAPHTHGSNSSHDSTVNIFRLSISDFCTSQCNQCWMSSSLIHSSAEGSYNTVPWNQRRHHLVPSLPRF